MRDPSNLIKASKTHSLKNLTPAKSRILCQIQEGTKVEKGKLCYVVFVSLTVVCGTEIIMMCDLLVKKGCYFFSVFIRGLTNLILIIMQYMYQGSRGTF